MGEEMMCNSNGRCRFYEYLDNVGITKDDIQVSSVTRDPDTVVYASYEDIVGVGFSRRHWRDGWDAGRGSNIALGRALKDLYARVEAQNNVLRDSRGERELISPNISQPVRSG